MNLLNKKCGPWAALVLRVRAAHLLPAVVGPAVAVASLLGAAPAFAQGSGVMTGTIVDTATKRPIPDAVVTVTSPSLQGEQTVVTDKSGSYRIPNLPPGAYTLRLEGDGYRPYNRGGITMRLDSTIRVNAELLPEGLKAEEVVVVGKAPTVDVGSSSTGVTINQDFVSRLALSPPGGKNAASRSFESLATVAPGAQTDQYGVSINGTTSPENAFLIDGVSVSDPAFGILGTPLSQEFIKEMSVITGGYLPEYGKAMGGIYDVVTKSGGNEFHGSAFFNITPGALDGPRNQVRSAGSVITNNQTLGSLRDFGAEVGGPILKDKLWFYAGVQFAFTTDYLNRSLSQFVYRPVTAKDPASAQCPAGTPSCMTQSVGADGFPVTTPLSTQTYLATQSSVQYIGKLTYLINQDHNLTLSVYGTPTRSGGNGSYGFDPQLNAPPVQLNGSFNGLANQVVADSTDVSLKYSGAFNNKRQLLDITLGYHHQHQQRLASDGSGPDQTLQGNTLAGTPNVYYRQTTPDYNSITQFEHVPAGSCPNVSTAAGSVTTCPVTQYYNGGPGFLDDVLLDSYQARMVFTDLLTLGGHHVIKAGVDFHYDSYTHDKAYSGTNQFQQNTDGSGFSDLRQYGFLTGPDQVDILSHYTARTTTLSIGGFLQDSWQIFDKVTLNVGVRYDAQVIYGADGSVGLSLPNQWSPRVGIIYDFTQQGRSKLFANYSRYYEGVPLDMADRSFPGEPGVYASHNASCTNPLDPTQKSVCGSGSAGVVPGNAANNPSQVWARSGGSKEPVDPNISPQSSDEYVVGGEYEIFSDARLGVTYTHRNLHRAIEDMSRDEANTYFIGNPGYGIASDFPKAVRDYDALTVHFQKTYSNTWLVTASYTLSRLYGNYAGLFRPETGQLDPNITSDFDLKSLLPNTTGPLPGDHTHQIKVFAAKDFLLPAGQGILVGLTFRSLSGGPLNILGAHPLYGQDEAFVGPRGSGGTLNADGQTVTQERAPWQHNIDLRLGYSAKLSKAAALALNVDIFNIFDFQAATLLDQSYTFRPVAPCQTGTLPNCVRPTDGGKPFNPKTDVNPNYGRALAFQDPRQFRIGAKVTF